MKTGAAITLAVALAVAGGAAGYWFAISRHAAVVTSSAPSSVGVATTDTTPAGSERKVLYWYDPMVPNQKFDKPGKSPFMDMQLVPKYADEAGGTGDVAIDPRIVQNLGVRTAEVRTAKMAPSVEAVGTIVWNERGVVVLQARTAGFVERLYARAPLDPVRKGAPLVELLVPDWAAAQEEYLALVASKMPGSDELRAAARQRLLLLGMSEGDVARLDADRRVQSRITLRSPIDGVVSELEVREGMTVMPGATLFRIVNLGTVWVNAQVPETLAAYLKPNAKVEARVAAYPGQVFKGSVNAILPEMDLATRTIRARIELSNPGGALKPGMFATLGFAPGSARNVLAVPSEAVIRTGERNVVIVAEAEGRFRPVDVEVGSDSGGETEIVKGLSPGDRVVVSGQFLIDSEASLRATGERLRSGTDTYRIEGRLEHATGDALTISHGAVPALKWPEMTMDFLPPPGGVPANVKAGDRIRFEFRQKGEGEWQVTRIEPDVPSPSAAGSAASAGPTAKAPKRPAVQDHSAHGAKP
jgi:Cu(I)/Ag(I) efflux system membrane fusion protein